MNDISQTGIKEECVFNSISSFHLTENYSVDISHDIFEGVGMYDMTEILYQLIVVDKLFSIDFVNESFNYFKYGRNFNKPPMISLDNLKKKKVNMSCAEMKSLVLCCGVILGPWVPQENKCWKLYTYLRKILDILLSDVVRSSDITT